MSNKLGRQTIKFKTPPVMRGLYSIVGRKEGQGPLGEYFDHILKNDDFGEKTYEKAEKKIIEHAIFHAIERAELKISDIDLLLSGDLLNQIISSTFSAREFDTTFIGLYGACSTSTESLALASCMIDGNYFNNVACSTGSHFATVERQFRYPLELGAQRPPTSQWTATGAGCTILSKEGKGNIITHATFGKVTDYGITDPNNMGAAMAPAAMRTMIAHFTDTNTTPDDYDLILTGDLGKLGSEIFNDLMTHQGYKLGKKHKDCGKLLFNENQNVNQGASGSACSAVVFNSYINPQISDGTYNKVLFGATGALLSTLSSQQGESVPGICHAVVIEKGN